MGVEPDRIDREILDLLTEDATLSRREIGDRVHLTGQAVGARIARLREEGILRFAALNQAAQRTLVKTGIAFFGPASFK